MAHHGTAYSKGAVTFISRPQKPFCVYVIYEKRIVHCAYGTDCRKRYQASGCDEKVSLDVLVLSLRLTIDALRFRESGAHEERRMPCHGIAVQGPNGGDSYTLRGETVMRKNQSAYHVFFSHTILVKQKHMRATILSRPFNSEVMSGCDAEIPGRRHEMETPIGSKPSKARDDCFLRTIVDEGNVMNLPVNRRHHRLEDFEVRVIRDNNGTDFGVRFRGGHRL
jgi:hypothetical protein